MDDCFGAHSAVWRERLGKFHSTWENFFSLFLANSAQPVVQHGHAQSRASGDSSPLSLGVALALHEGCVGEAARGLAAVSETLGAATRMGIAEMVGVVDRV